MDRSNRLIAHGTGYNSYRRNGSKTGRNMLITTLQTSVCISNQVFRVMNLRNKKEYAHQDDRDEHRGDCL